MSLEQFSGIYRGHSAKPEDKTMAYLIVVKDTNANTTEVTYTASEIVARRVCDLYFMNMDESEWHNLKSPDCGYYFENIASGVDAYIEQRQDIILSEAVNV